MKKWAEPKMENIHISEEDYGILTIISATGDDQECGNNCTTPEEMLEKNYECWSLEF